MGRENKVSISVITDPETLRLVRGLGFEGKVLVDRTEEGSIVFLSDNCAMCDEPWTVKCRMGESGTLYLCDAHLEKARANRPNPVHVMLRRISIESL